MVLVMKNRIRTTSFWIGLASVSVLVIDALSGVCGFSICSDNVIKAILGLSSILVVLGFVNKKDVDTPVANKDDLLSDLNTMNNYSDSSNNVHDINLNKSTDNIANKYTDSIDDESD